MSTVSFSFSVTIPFPDPATGNCVNCCTPTLAVAISCVSRAGTASLCGWSGYRPDGNTQLDSDPTAPWQGRKWQEKTLSGSILQASNICSGCGNINSGNLSKRSFAGTATLDCTGFTTYGSYVDERTDDGDCDEANLVTYSSSSTQTEISLPAGNTATVDEGGCSYGAFIVEAVRARTLLMNTLTGCDCVQLIDYRRQTGEMSAELVAESEDTFFDALGRVEPPIEPGVECCAYITAVDLTSPESQSPLSKTGQGVELTLVLTGGVPSTAYIIDLEIIVTDMADVFIRFDHHFIPTTTDASGMSTETYVIPDPVIGEKHCSPETATATPA